MLAARWTGAAFRFLLQMRVRLLAAETLDYVGKMPVTGDFYSAYNNFRGLRSPAIHLFPVLELHIAPNKPVTGYVDYKGKKKLANPAAIGYNPFIRTL
jgi:hypothetical protein